MPNFRNYVNFHKILILLAHIRHILKIFEFSKKKFFCDFRWDLQANLNVFFTFFDMSKNLLNFVCHVSENQKFCMRQHFGTKSAQISISIYLRTCGTKFFHFSLRVWNFGVNRKTCWIYKPI